MNSSRVSALAFLASACVISAASGQSYRVVDLGKIGFEPMLPSGAGFDAPNFRLNEKGQVAYASLDPATQGVNAAVWLAESDYGLDGETIHLLPAMFSTAVPSIAYDINESGQVVGHDGFDGGPLEQVGEAIVWDLASSVATPLGFLQPGGTWSRALGITDGPDPVIVGESEETDICREDCEAGTPMNPAPFLEAFFLTLSSSGPSAKKTFETNHCDASTFVRDVVRTPGLVIVAGFTDQLFFDDPCNQQAFQCDGTRDPTYWIAAGMMPLPNVLPRFSPVWGAESRAVNRRGDMVGWGQDQAPDCHVRAVLWPSGRQSFINLHAETGLGVFDRTRAEGLNDEVPPKVVGHEMIDDAAFLWEPVNGSWEDWIATDLNTEIPPGYQGTVDLRQGMDVNNDGWILTWGRDDAGEAHVYLLIPEVFVPNPCQADFDNDGLVGFGDLSTLLGAWGTSFVGRLSLDTDLDLDFDFEVGFADMTVLIGEWGPCD